MTDGIVRQLAKRRVPLGFLAAGGVLWLARPTGSSLVWGGLVAAIGESLRVWAAGHLNKSREVTASGPYRSLAHPLYVGSSLMGVGLAVASRDLVVTILIALYLGTTIPAAIRSEEAFLRGRFGDEYDRYRQRGRGEAGGGSQPDGGAARRFRLAQALANREHRAVGGLALIVLFLALKAMYDGTFWRTGTGP